MASECMLIDALISGRRAPRGALGFGEAALMASECMLIDALISGLPRCCCCANADCPPHRVDCLSHQVRLLCLIASLITLIASLIR